MQSLLQKNVLSTSDEVARFLGKTRWWVLLILMSLAPFHAFLITWLKSAAGGESTWVTAASAWREIFVAIIGFLVMAEILIKKTLPRFDSLDIIISAYFLLSLLWLAIQRDEPVRWLLGFRFDVLPFLFYVIVKHAVWPKRELIFKISLAIAAAVVVFGLLHALALPKNFLTYFGYSQYQGQYRPDVPIAACQYLENTDRVCRATSTFGGPTRYGTYLLLVLGILQKNVVAGLSRTILFLLVAISIILTYSRSIWIGAMVMAVGAGILFLKKKNAAEKTYRIIAPIFLIILTIITLIVVGFSKGDGGFLKKIFMRESSTSEHFYLARQGVITAMQHPLGLGLGVSGPATMRIKKSLTENQFIQIAVEMGIPGLLLFLAILVLLAMSLKGNGLFLSLLGISVAGLFTHSFEETTTMLILMAFFALQKQKTMLQ